MPLINHFLLGCDPEFAIFKRGKILFNSYTLPDSWNPEIGSDHSGAVIELRPKPQYSAGKLIKEISRLLAKLVPKVPQNSKWVSGPSIKGKTYSRSLPTAEELYGERDNCRTYALGGHIHLGTWYDTKSAYIPEMLSFTRWTRLVKLFDPSKLRSRWTIGYGALRDIRESDHDSKIEYERYGPPNHLGYYQERIKYAEPGHIEYRALPSWLFSPKVALLILCGMKLALARPGLWGEILRDSRKDAQIAWATAKTALDPTQALDDDASALSALLRAYPHVDAWRTPPDHHFLPNWQQPKGLTYEEVNY